MGETPTPTRFYFRHTVAFCVACVFSCAAYAQTAPGWGELVGRNLEVRHTTPEGEADAAGGTIGGDGTLVLTAGDAVVGIALADVTLVDVTYTEWTITTSTTIDNEITTVINWDGRGFGVAIPIDDDTIYIGEPGFEIPGGLTQRTSMLNAGVWFAAGLFAWWIFIVSYRRRSWTL